MELYQFPSVTALLPIDSEAFSPQHQLQIVNKVTKELQANYVKSKWEPIVSKLSGAFLNINRETAKKGVAISISPIQQKIIYLDVAFDEKIVVDEPLEMRDLVHAIFPASKFLMVVQSALSYRFFIGEQINLLRLKTNATINITEYENSPERLIREIDKELGKILTKYDLPVFVLGTEHMNRSFEKLTNHNKSVLDYIHGSFDNSKPHQLLSAIRPYLSEFINVERYELQHQIEQAILANKLSIGISEVWRNANEKKGKLLLIEKNYSHHADSSNVTHDVVDQVIEKVLQYGGKVQFVDAGIMESLRHIAMFLYY